MRSNAPPTVPASVKHLLASNELPSDAEISLLRGLCASFSAELTRLDDKSAENRSRIHSLLDALMFHSRRWARISLAVPCELGTYLGAVQGKVPELRHLTFMGCDLKFLWKAWRKNNAPHMISLRWPQN